MLWLIVLVFAVKARSQLAKLSDANLSKFLSQDIIMGGVLIGLGQLTFLVFASIQCNASVPKFDWEECRRTLVSQVGLSFMVMLYVIIKLLSGVVSKHILEKHTISAKRFAAMRMNSEEFVQSFGLLISCFCALFPLGN